MKGSKKRTTSFLPFCIFKIQGSGRWCFALLLLCYFGQLWLSYVCLRLYALSFSMCVYLLACVFVHCHPFRLKSALQLTDCPSSLLFNPVRIESQPPFSTSFTPLPCHSLPCPIFPLLLSLLTVFYRG